MPRKKKEPEKPKVSYTHMYTKMFGGVNYLVLEKSDEFGVQFVDVVEADQVKFEFDDSKSYRMELTDGNDALDAWAMNECEEYDDYKEALKDIFYDEVHGRGELNKEHLLSTHPKSFFLLVEYLVKQYVKPMFKAIFKGEHDYAPRSRSLREEHRM